MTGWALLDESTLAQRREWLARRRSQRGRSTPAQRQQRLAHRKAQHSRGMSGWFGDSAEDFRKKAEATVEKLQLLLDEIGMGMEAYRDNRVLQQQGGTYKSAVQMTINQTNPDTLVIQFKAGGSNKDNAYKMLDAADKVYSRVTEMFEADAKDPTGSAGTAIAKARLGEARANLLRLDKKSEFWEMGGFGGGAIGFFENLKKYAKWILIGGGLLLVAPVVMPFIGRAVGGYKSGRASTVKANRRRRR
jgi:hypothetical protein